MSFELICPQWVRVFPIDVEKSPVDKRAKSGGTRRAYLPSFRVKVQLDPNEDRRRDAGGRIGGSEQSDWVAIARTRDFGAKRYTPKKGDRWEPERDIAERKIYVLSAVPTAPWGAGIFSAWEIDLADKAPARIA